MIAFKAFFDVETGIALRPLQSVYIVNGFFLRWSPVLPCWSIVLQQLAKLGPGFAEVLNVEKIPPSECLTSRVRASSNEMENGLT
jgi:hypothetical protein